MCPDADQSTALLRHLDVPLIVGEPLTSYRKAERLVIIFPGFELGKPHTFRSTFEEVGERGAEIFDHGLIECTGINLFFQPRVVFGEFIPDELVP